MDKTGIKHVNLKFKKKGGENMLKRLIMGVAAVALTVSFAGVSEAAIATSKHNFSSSGTGTYKGTATTRMCIFCHTPHNAVLNVPLWNRSGAQAGTYNLYTSSGTLSDAVNGASSSIGTENISYKCLSCHDGQLAIGGGVWNTFGQDVTTGNLGKITTSANLGGSGGSDLTNDHPIGFDFSSVSGTAAGKDPYIYNITIAEAAGMKFYNAGLSKTNQMECASCHDVHNNAAPGTKFLRTSNNGSALCLSCHNK